MSDATRPPAARRRPGRRPQARAALAAVLVAAALAAGPARAEDEPAEKPEQPNRVWRAIKGVPGQIGSATKRAARGIGDAFDRDDDGEAAPPAAAPAPAPAPKKPAAAPQRVRPRPKPAQAEAKPTEPPVAEVPPAEMPADPMPAAAPPSAPAAQPPSAPAAEAPPAPPPDDRRGLRAALLLGAFLVAGAGVALALARRRHPALAEPGPTVLLPEIVPPPTPAETARSLAPTMPLQVSADFAPAPTVAFPRDTVRVPPTGPPTVVQGATGFDAAALDARTEAAVADALAAERPAAFPGGGRYELLAEIGRGGMGVVYRARDKRLDRVVALKRLPENLQAHPRAVEMLLREARSAAQLNHPHIVTVYDVDREEDGGYFLTMEYLEGEPLSTLLHRRGRFAASEVAWLGRQAAAGLAYAHERRIVHRDVKTANLFLTRERVVKIMDFGLAKMMEAVRRRSTRIGGTPDYMAPEQTLGLAVDGRADLYALGVTLFEMLTGTVPFEEGDAMRHHRETRPPDTRERVPDVPASLAELVLSLLAKTPDERPATAAEVAERLRAIERETLRG